MSTPQPGVLAETELRAVATKFGVADDQVRRDHLISHVLAAIQFVPGVVFYGGTALTRTVLPDLRLSEDVDLLVSRSRREVARELSDAIDDGLARSFGEVNWVPALDATHDHYSGYEVNSISFGHEVARVRVGVRVLFG